MRAPAFWWQRPGLAAALLSPAGWLYGAIAASRLAQQGARAARPVVCVGNPTLGGAGKTPTAIAIAALLAETGEQPVFLSRGYGGKLEGPHLVDATRDNAAAVGDEPLLLARAAPTVIARHRPAGAALAATLGSVVVMDDGFQNPSLTKDLSLLVVDAAVGLGNGLVFPAGPLRAPLEPQLARADAIVLIGDGPGIEEEGLYGFRPTKPESRIPVAENPVSDQGFSARSFPGSRRDLPETELPMLRARLEPDAQALEGAGPILAFAGIGRPQKFADTLAALGRAPQRFVAFPDHHRLSAADAARLLDQAARENLTLVTTEKDLARLKGEPALDKLAAACRALPVRLEFEDDAPLRRLLAAALKSSSSQAEHGEDPGP